MDSKLLLSFVGCTYHNILISDHAPVSSSLDLNHKRGEHNWRLNNTPLKDKEFSAHLSNKTELYVSTNDTGYVDSTLLLWEARKAVLRGHKILYEAAAKKKKRQD